MGGYACCTIVFDASKKSSLIGFPLGVSLVVTFVALVTVGFDGAEEQVSGQMVFPSEHEKEGVNPVDLCSVY